MKLIYQPLETVFVTQAFGENRVCISNTDGTLIGCDGNNPPQGYRSLYGTKGHLGTDMAATSRVKLFCAQRGHVYHIDTNKRSGLDVRIESNEDGRRIRCIYEHMSRVDVQVGDFVETGQVIGLPGKTGYATGEHLHFQVEEFILGEWVAIDPMTIMEMTPANKVLILNNKVTFLKEKLALLADQLATYLRRKALSRITN